MTTHSDSLIVYGAYPYHTDLIWSMESIKWWGHGDLNAGLKTPSLEGWTKLPYGPSIQSCVAYKHVIPIYHF